MVSEPSSDFGERVREYGFFSEKKTYVAKICKE
jgi:hypothetical protein